MRLVYIISAYKLPQQLVRLVNRLNTAEATFFIHVDRKSRDAVYRQMTAALGSLTNVHFLDRHVCHRCYFGHVLATLKGIQEIYRRREDFDYVLLLTGQDYPIKTNDHIDSFFRNHSGESFLYHFNLPTKHWSGGGLDRVNYWHYHWFGMDLRFPRNSTGGKFLALSKIINHFLPVKRTLPHGLKPFGGSGYWCFSKEAVRYVYNYVNDHPEFVRFFQSVYIPDELFFHTILLNSPLAGTLVNDDLRYIDWSKSRPGTKPSVLNRDDLDALRNTPDLLARKFDVTTDGEILDLIDREILGVR